MLLTFFAPASAWACSCSGPMPRCEAAAVFAGTVTEIIEETNPTRASFWRIRRQVVHFKITEQLLDLTSGKEEIEIETGMGGGDCGYRFEKDLSYVVYASRMRDGKGKLVTTICSRTKPLAQAKEDLDYFRSRKSGPDVAEISIQVLGLSDSNIPAEKLQGVSLTITGPETDLLKLSDSSGHQSFANLPSGEYGITAVFPGYRRANTKAFVVPKGCAEVTMLLETEGLK